MLCRSNVVDHCFIQKALHSLTGERVISAVRVRIETAASVFRGYDNNLNSLL